MQDLENNGLFWQKVDALYLSGDFTLAHKKGDVHPKNKSLKFPCDYGYIKTLSSDFEETIAVYRGSAGKKIMAVAVCADIIKRVIETKILVGLSEEETESLMRFLNQNENMKAILIKRGKKIPAWAITE